VHGRSQIWKENIEISQHMSQALTFLLFNEFGGIVECTFTVNTNVEVEIQEVDTKISNAKSVSHPVPHLFL